MPVPNNVTKGQTVEIRCEQKKTGEFANTLYTIRYFQFDGGEGKHAENGFAIRTLALPVIQCFGIVNNRNEFHARYNTLLNEITNEVNGFGKYIETSEVLVSIKNEYNIWERALSLPFIYS